MKRKTLADYERERKKTNERQRKYREEHRELYNIWRLRSYANTLRKAGWTCTPPPDFPTLEQEKTKRQLAKLLDSPPIDLSDASAIMGGLNPDDLPFT